MPTSMSASWSTSSAHLRRSKTVLRFSIPCPIPQSVKQPTLHQLGGALLLAGQLVASGGDVFGQQARRDSPAEKSELAAADQSPRWRDLKSRTQKSLKPLEDIWSGISTDQKLKWIEIAQLMPAMSDDEQARVQLRMSEWVMLGPEERSQTRVNFQQAKRLPLEQRQTQWQTYLALSEEERRILASRKVLPAEVTKKQQPTKAGAAASHSRSAKAAAPGGQKKSKITPNPAFSLPPTPVAPTLVHPSYGATTTLLTKANSPPPHQQVGLPKIISSSRFIDPKTLLPRRGPQAAVSYNSEFSYVPLERP